MFLICHCYDIWGYCNAAIFSSPASAGGGTGRGWCCAMSVPKGTGKVCSLWVPGFPDSTGGLIAVPSSKKLHGDQMLVRQSDPTVTVAI